MTEKFGVSPGQVVDVLALMGDTIDNVKGVPGIGEKGGRDLISTYGSLDALLEHALAHEVVLAALLLRWATLARRRGDRELEQGRHALEQDLLERSLARTRRAGDDDDQRHQAAARKTCLSG